MIPSPNSQDIPTRSLLRVITSLDENGIYDSGEVFSPRRYKVTSNITKSDEVAVVDVHMKREAEDINHRTNGVFLSPKDSRESRGRGYSLDMAAMSQTNLPPVNNKVFPRDPKIDVIASTCILKSQSMDFTDRLSNSKTNSVQHSHQNRPLSCRRSRASSEVEIDSNFCSTRAPSAQSSQSPRRKYDPRMHGVLKSQSLDVIQAMGDGLPPIFTSHIPPPSSPNARVRLNSRDTSNRTTNESSDRSALRTPSSRRRRTDSGLSDSCGDSPQANTSSPAGGRRFRGFSMDVEVGTPGSRDSYEGSTHSPLMSLEVLEINRTRRNGRERDRNGDHTLDEKTAKQSGESIVGASTQAESSEVLSSNAISKKTSPLHRSSRRSRADSGHNESCANSPTCNDNPKDSVHRGSRLRADSGQSENRGSLPGDSVLRSSPRDDVLRSSRRIVDKADSRYCNDSPKDSVHRGLRIRADSGQSENRGSLPGDSVLRSSRRSVEKGEHGNSDDSPKDSVHRGSRRRADSGQSDRCGSPKVRAHRGGAEEDVHHNIHSTDIVDNGTCDGPKHNDSLGKCQISNEQLSHRNSSRDDGTRSGRRRTDSAASEICGSPRHTSHRGNRQRSESYNSATDGCDSPKDSVHQGGGCRVDSAVSGSCDSPKESVLRDSPAPNNHSIDKRLRQSGDSSKSGEESGHVSQSKSRDHATVPDQDIESPPTSSYAALLNENEEIALIKLRSAFNDKMNAKLALQECGHAPVFHRALLSFIKEYNDLKLCSRDLRVVILKGLEVLCDANLPTSHDLVEEIVVFLLAAFQDLLKLRDVFYMKHTIHLVGVIACKSEVARSKLHHHRVLTKMIDAVVVHTAPNFVQETSLAHNIVDIALKTQLLNDLYYKLKKMMITVSLLLSDLEEETYLSMITENIPRFEDSKNILRKGRNLISSLVRQDSFHDENKEYLRSSNLIARLIDSCVMDDLSNCSHLLKVFVIFGDDKVLRGYLLQENAAKFTQLFKATLRCTENSVEDSLMKFWLVKSTCDNLWLRNFLFQREGVILELLTMMRTTCSLDPGESMNVLATFCDDTYFFDLSLTTAQVIQRFGEIFQTSEFTACARDDANELLLIFAEGLENKFHANLKSASVIAAVDERKSEKKLSISDSLANSFIESTVLFRLLSCITISDCGSEWRAKGSNLLKILIRNQLIQDAFMDEPLGILLCAVRHAVDSFADMSSMVLELVSITEIVAVNSDTHARLFEIGVVREIVNFVIHVNQMKRDAISDEGKGNLIVRCLAALDVISIASRKSSALLLKWDIELVLELLLNLKNKAVSEQVDKTLKHLNQSGATRQNTTQMAGWLAQAMFAPKQTDLNPMTMAVPTEQGGHWSVRPVLFWA